MVYDDNDLKLWVFVEMVMADIYLRTVITDVFLSMCVKCVMVSNVFYSVSSTEVLHFCILWPKKDGAT